MNLKLRGLTACAVVAVAGASFAQTKTLTFSQLISGDSGIALSMKLSRMPESYKPIHISDGGGGGGLMDMIMSPMMMMMGAFGQMSGGKGGSDSEGMAALQMLDISWTKGQVVGLEGQRYLVVYKLGVDMSMIAAGANSSMPNFASMPLKLSLLRVDGIKSIAPASDVTRASYIKALTPPKPKPAGEIKQ